jgi:hypothetical protein
MAGLTSRQPRVVETRVSLPAGKARAGLSRTQGARLIDSTPAATVICASPVSTSREQIMAASRLDPQSRFTVVAGRLTGSPASRTAIRATLRFSSPAPLALPMTTSPMVAGSSPGVRASRAVKVAAAMSSGRMPDSAPPYRPKGVRTEAYRKAGEGGMA